MNAPRTILRALATSLLVLPASALQATGEIPLRYSPAEGTILRKQWSSRQVLRPAAAYSQIGDDRTPIELNLTLDATQKVTAIDQLNALEDGRPTKLRRLYERAGLETVLSYAGQRPIEMNQTSELEGTSVVFTWVPHEMDHGKYYDAREADEFLLAGLWEDLDARDLLPADGAAAIGESWTAEATALGDVLAAGGDVPLGAPEEAEPMTLRSLRAGVGAHMFRAFENCAGTGGWTMTLVGVEERPEGRVAKIGIEARVRLASDQTHYVRDHITIQEKGMGAVYHGSDLIVDLTGRGELLWMVDQARALSLTLDAGTETTYRIRNSYRRDGDQVREQMMRMSGRLEIRMAVEALDAFPDVRANDSDELDAEDDEALDSEGDEPRTKGARKKRKGGGKKKEKDAGGGDAGGSDGDGSDGDGDGDGR